MKTPQMGSADAGTADAWNRLLRYYRACIMHESGVSELIPREAQGGRYIFLPGGREPLLSDVDGEIALDPRLRELAGRARERGESLYYGYPVLVFHEPGAGGARRQLAPLFAYELALPDGRGPLPAALQPRTDEPFLHASALARLGYRDEQQTMLIDGIAAEEWIGDSAAVGEHVSALLATLGVRCVEPIDPAALSEVAEGQIDGVGAHNVAMVFRGVGGAYHGRLLEELQLLESQWPAAQRTSASFLLGPPSPEYLAVGESSRGPTPPPDLAVPIPVNDAQRAALQSAMTEPLTVVTGPPGTGKSQLVTCIIASAWLSGQSVLVASTNNQAVDVACARAKELWPGLVVRTGSRNHREAAKAELLQLLDERTHSPDASALAIRFLAAHDQATRARTAADDLATWEDRLVAVQLGRETLAASIKRHPEAIAGKLNDRVLQRAERTLRKFAAGRGLFRGWRLQRMSRQFGFDVAANLSAAAGFFTLELEWRDLKRRLAGGGSYDESWRDLMRSERAYEAASADSVRAVARAAFQLGAGPIRRFTKARAQYGVPGGASDVFPDALRFVRSWASTALSAAATIPLRPALFDIVVIDEASQCSIPAILPLLFRARRAVIIGDPMQLSHITSMSRKDDESRIHAARLHPAVIEADWLSYRTSSVFRAMSKSVSQVHLLDEHYRSHPEIVEIANRLFYNSGLTVLTDPKRLRRLDLPALSWHDVKGRATRPAGGSALNAAEVKAVVAVVVRLALQTDFDGTVGVVTPFSAQARSLSRALEQALPEPDRQRLQLGVGTAHRFQGDERDVMILSPVVADGLPVHTIAWIVGTPNLLNVAITRARSTLIVVGDEAFCRRLPGPLSELAKYVSELEVRRKVEATASRGELHSEAELRLFEALIRAEVNVVPKVTVQGYEADFVIRAGNVIINLECDGRHHKNGAGRQRRQDRARDGLIQAMGWRVVRVPAWRCLQTPVQVAEQIGAQIKSLAEAASADPA